MRGNRKKETQKKLLPLVVQNQQLNLVNDGLMFALLIETGFGLLLRRNVASSLPAFLSVFRLDLENFFFSVPSNIFLGDQTANVFLAQ